MKNLNSTIDNYLSKPTKFAIQIVGGWGHGKTFFYRNTLEKLINEKPTHDNETKKYKPIYISLFGLKSVEDIATKIVLEFYQSKYFKTYYKKSVTKKRLKITQNIFKIGFRGFINFKRLGNITDYLTDIKTIGENVLDTNEILICFDDLERKASSLKFEDLIGYINSLVDEGIKILIITNDDELLKDDLYRNFTEKIIGIRIEYNPNTKETLESIIKSRYSGYPTYLKYLSDNIEILIKLSRSTNNNFRNIIYALDCLHNFYSIIKTNIFDLKHEISEKLQNEVLNISILIVALSIDYKSSHIKYSDSEEFVGNYIFLREYFRDKTKEPKSIDEVKNKLERLLMRYEISRENYQFYNSIFSYVTGHDEFSIDTFIIEFKQLFNLEKGNVLPQYELLSSLSYQNCFTFSDQEYHEKTLLLIKNAEIGLYSAADYLTIMHCAERFDNPFSLDLNDVKEKLLIGLKKSIQSTSSTDLTFSQFIMSGRTDDLSEINKQIYEAGKEEIDFFKDRKEKEKFESVANLLSTNISEFLHKFQNDDILNKEISSFPLFNYIEMELFFKNIKKTDGQTLNILRVYFIERYYNKEILEQEFEFLQKLDSLITTYIVEQEGEDENKIRLYIIRLFKKSLIEILKQKLFL